MSVATDYVKRMIDSAKVKKQRQDLQDGEYVVTVLGLTHEIRKGREKMGKPIWVDYVIDEAEGEGANDLNTKLDNPISIDGQNAEMGFADLKRLLQELTGCEDAEVSSKYDALVDHVSDEGKHSNPSQPARGMKLGMKARAHIIKSGKNVGKTKYYPRWINIGPQDAATIVARRAEVDKLDL